MEKKYELIKKNNDWFRVRTLKDFTLITGEQVKKGDVGGHVKTKNCLSQEGKCWIMDEAYVEGEVSGNAVVKDCATVKTTGVVSGNAVVRDETYVDGQVSGNAVIKDFAKVYGNTCGNAVIKDCAKVYGVVLGNAIVKDYAYVEKNVIAAENAMAQANQCINYGTVTTDLLGTKDWTGALYAELGIVPKNGKITLYKRVWSTDNPKIFKSNHNSNFTYEIGKEAIETDVDEDVMKYCGKGLHFTSLEFIGFYVGNAILECEVDLEDIITVQYDVVRARKCRVIKTIEEEK